jgi:hypothetical protein
MKTYGRLDGEIAYQLATAFAKVGQSLTAAQEADLMELRTKLLGNLATPTGAYLYSEPIAMPEIPSTDFLFAAPAGAASPTLRIASGHKSDLASTYGTAAWVRNGTYATLQVSVLPAAANTPVRIYRRIGKTGPWTFLSSGRTTAGGSLAWSTVVRVPATATGYGRYVYYRVAVPGTSAGSLAWSSTVRAVAG